MQTATVPAAQPYTFLSQPPASKKRSAQPAQDATTAASLAENPRRRSTSAMAINSWAASVQPGPPAPISPARLDAAASITTTNATTTTTMPARASRRKSVAPAPPSPVAYLPAESDSPTSSSSSHHGDAKDLPAVGYTSIFVTLPKTPPAEVTVTPDRRRSVQIPKMAAPALPPLSPVAEPQSAKTGGGFARLRSLSVRPGAPAHARTKSAAAVEDAQAKKERKEQERRERKERERREKERRQEEAARPLQMSQEIALMQFMGGGSIEHHVKRYAEKQAKREGRTRGADGQVVGVEVPHRDARGRVWRDEDEALEYAGLLGEQQQQQEVQAWDWVQLDEQRGAVGHPYAYAEVDPLDTSVLPSSGKTRHGNASARQEFVDASFRPSVPAKAAVSASPVPSGANVDSSGAKKSVLKGLFKSKKAVRA